VAIVPAHQTPDTVLPEKYGLESYRLEIVDKLNFFFVIKGKKVSALMTLMKFFDSKFSEIILTAAIGYCCQTGLGLGDG